MENELVVGHYPFPCICLDCGAWYDRKPSSACQSCGRPPNPATSAFYEWCITLEKDFEQHFHRADIDRIRRALVGHTELHYGWSDTVLALIAAIGLGVLSNTSYDIIKVWLLSRKDEFLKNRFVADYDTTVEIVVDYLRQHPYLVREFNFDNEELKIKFSRSINPLIKAVEQNAKISDKPEP